MIRSSKTSLKFSNKSKLEELSLVITEYRSVIKQFIDLLWDLEKIPILIAKEITSKVKTWLSARAIQCAGKQASGIIRGTKQKQKQRQFVVKQLNRSEEHT